MLAIGDDYAIVASGVEGCGDPLEQRSCSLNGADDLGSD
jgi:hypothetical protein